MCSFGHEPVERIVAGRTRGVGMCSISHRPAGDRVADGIHRLFVFPHNQDDSVFMDRHLIVKAVAWSSSAADRREV